MCWSTYNFIYNVKRNSLNVDQAEECAQVLSELSKYIGEHGVFGNLHATKDHDRLSPIEMVEHVLLLYHILT